MPAWAGAGPEWSLADRRLLLPRRLAASGSRAGLAKAIERTERILPLLEVPEPVICHGDFHPGNLLVDGHAVAVIDWTDAGIGDRHGDIARTAWVFHYAAAVARHRRQRLILRTLAPALSRAYLSSYRRALPVDAGRLRLWMPLQFLHAWAAAAAGEQAGSDLAAWAQKQFWRHLERLP